MPDTGAGVMLLESIVAGDGGDESPRSFEENARSPPNGRRMSIGRGEPAGASSVWHSRQRPAIAAR
jgi:hypothetical protein